MSEKGKKATAKYVKSEKGKKANAYVELLKNAINMKNIHRTVLKSILNDSLENST